MTRRLDELGRAICADTHWLGRVSRQGRPTVQRRLGRNIRAVREIVALSVADTDEVVLLTKRKEPQTTPFKRPRLGSCAE